MFIDYTSELPLDVAEDLHFVKYSVEVILRNAHGSRLFCVDLTDQEERALAKAAGTCFAYDGKHCLITPEPLPDEVWGRMGVNGDEAEYLSAVYGRDSMFIVLKTGEEVHRYSSSPPDLQRNYLELVTSQAYITWEGFENLAKGRLYEPAPPDDRDLPVIWRRVVHKDVALAQDDLSSNTATVISNMKLVSFLGTWSLGQYFCYLQQCDPAPAQTFVGLFAGVACRTTYGNRERLIFAGLSSCSAQQHPYNGIYGEGSLVDFFRIKWNMAIHPYLPAMKDKRGNYFPLDLLVPLEGQFAKNSFLDSFPVVPKPWLPPRHPHEPLLSIAGRNFLWRFGVNVLADLPAQQVQVQPQAAYVNCLTWHEPSLSPVLEEGSENGWPAQERNRSVSGSSSAFSMSSTG